MSKLQRRLPRIRASGPPAQPQTLRGFLGFDGQLVFHFDLKASQRLLFRFVGATVNTFPYNVKLIMVNVFNISTIYCLSAALMKKKKKEINKEEKFRPSKS